MTVAPNANGVIELPLFSRAPGGRDGWRFGRLTEPRTVLPGLSDEFGDPDGPLNLMNRVNAGCISRILSSSAGILEDKT